MSFQTTPKEYSRLIKLVQGRYKALHALTLTRGQAECIYKYEADKNLESKDKDFLQWEEYDFEWATYKDILTSDQFEMYEADLKTRLRNYESALVEEDNRKFHEIEYNQSLLTILEEKILPDCLNQAAAVKLTGLFQETTKIDFLKAEYKRYLNATKKMLLVDHFRFARTCMPNLLKITLLQHKLDYIWPNYFQFNQWMDEPTRATATYLRQKLYYIQDKIYDHVKTKFAELTTLNEENYRRHWGDRNGPQVTFGPSTPEDRRDHLLMSLLLLDKDQYGWQE
ncbi:hypothetical protein GCM10028803_25290 [Larkinella knui]|uniref:Uncharacterized protein n=1 Tax=Larkinella knui TaxID=2025310 RepID=A0A3P1CW92_9BACT|nr:hypothetical protein [Larkinella knui]RRB17585.1 hypothetical protein EHT87_04680 [Larkinella knui]